MATGRPRAFDIDEALERAMRVFWQHGYEGASLDDLTGAMRINRPSLYAAFGNKQALFAKALDRYQAGPADYVREALEAPTSRAVAKRILEGAIHLLTDPRNPKGCLFVQGALACSSESDDVRAELAARRDAGVALMRRRFKRAIAEGDLPTGADAAALARYVATLAHGLAVQAASGAGKKELLEVARLALRSWPR